MIATFFCFESYLTIIFITIWCIYVKFFFFLDEHILFMTLTFRKCRWPRSNIWIFPSRMVTKKKDWFLPICFLWPYTNDNGNLIFRFEEFDLIKLYLCSHSSCQCRLIYARKNIETQTATKYFITGTKNFILNLYPFCRKWCTNTVSVLEKLVFLQHTLDILITFQNGRLMGTAWKYDVK